MYMCLPSDFNIVCIYCVYCNIPDFVFIVCTCITIYLTLCLLCIYCVYYNIPDFVFIVCTCITIYLTLCLLCVLQYTWLCVWLCLKALWLFNIIMSVICLYWYKTNECGLSIICFCFKFLFFMLWYYHHSRCQSFIRENLFYIGVNTSVEYLFPNFWEIVRKSSWLSF